MIIFWMPMLAYRRWCLFNSILFSFCELCINKRMVIFLNLFPRTFGFRFMILFAYILITILILRMLIEKWLFFGNWTSMRCHKISLFLVKILLIFFYSPNMIGRNIMASFLSRHNWWFELYSIINLWWCFHIINKLS